MHNKVQQWVWEKTTDTVLAVGMLLRVHQNHGILSGYSGQDKWAFGEKEQIDMPRNHYLR